MHGKLPVTFTLLAILSPSNQSLSNLDVTHMRNFSQWDLGKRQEV